ncbi:MAG: glmM, partial [Acidimicrobiia bacterium]|nr:glmM [Acidimicrobiia bacterium]
MATAFSKTNAAHGPLKFGTDGVRGVANTELTPEFALALGRAAARVLGFERVVVGRDPRRSGSLLEAALCAGLASEGVAVEVLGVVPTPAVAWLAAQLGCGGAMISASHNAFADNGIKLFAVGGRKLTDGQEAALEAELAVVVSPTRSGEQVGTITQGHELDDYVDAVVSSVSSSLSGLHVVVDAANGATLHTAPEVLRQLGVQLHVINAHPDGININHGCGATDPAALQRAVVELGADVGLALDGDGDRCVAVDAQGQVVDGDQLIAICALDRLAAGRLAHDTVVVTVMTNLGFRLAMADHGVTIVETAVGDRYVLDALDEGGFVLGGEQSGHVIFRDLAGTGDGILTGVQVLDAMVRAQRPLADLAGVMTRYPQRLLNVRVAHRDPALVDHLEPDIAAAQARLGDQGRLLIRASGTE